MNHPSSSFSEDNNNNNNQKRKRSSSPTVDSQLLRFLYTQKKKANEKELLVSTLSSNTIGTTNVEETNPGLVATTRASMATTTPPTVVLPTPELYYQQFNRNKIALLLQEYYYYYNSAEQTKPIHSTPQQQQQHDPEETTADDNETFRQLAQDAGSSVQTYAVSRMAKRKVRDFLKRREQSFWTPPAIRTSTSSSKTTSSSLTQQQQQQHSLQETITLLLQYGLNIKDIATLFVHTPQVALMRPHQCHQEHGETLQTTLDRAMVHLLSNQLGLRKYDVRRMIRQTPGLLSKRGSQSATQVIEILQQLGVSTNSIARDKNSLPALLTRSPAEFFRFVAFLSSDAVRMPLRTIGPLLRRPICQPLLDIVAPSSLSFRNIMDGNMDNNNSSGGGGRLVWDSRILEQRKDSINQVYRNMTETAWFLRYEIGTADLSRVIAAYPSVLLLNVHDILKRVDFLSQNLGIQDEKLVRVLQSYPMLLGEDLEKMREVVDYMERLGVSNESMTSIFRSFPQLLTMKVEEMQCVIDYLEQSVGISNIGRFVTRLPPILGYSIKEELEPKWNFLQTVCTDARFELSRFPAYFSYPLERVIRPRFEYLRDEKSIPVQLLSIEQVLCLGDQDFARKVAGDPSAQSYQSFCNSRNEKKRKIRRKPRSGKAS